MAERVAISLRLADALKGEPRTMGIRVTDAYLRIWEDADSRPVGLDSSD